MTTLEDASAEGTGDGPGDPVSAVVDAVAAELAAKRERGDLPTFPRDELERQFDAVVEAVDGGLDLPPIDPAGLRSTAELQTWQPDRKRNPVRQLIGIAFRPLSRIIGVVVRRQTGPFAARTTDLIEAVVDRQNRLISFVGRTHLDRIRTLEYRIAELEREVDDLRSGTPGAD